MPAVAANHAGLADNAVAGYQHGDGVAADCGADNRRMGFRLARIARHRFRPATRFAYQCRRLRQLVRAPRTQDYRRTLFCQQQGRCPADARRCADDSGNFVVQVQY